MVGIYKIESPSGKVYIGQSWDVNRRLKQYKSLDCKTQTKIFNSLNFYSPEKHLFEIELELRDDISQASLDCWEEYYMDLYKSKGVELLNLSKAGSFGKLSEESRKKMSENHADFSGKNHPMYGKKMPKHVIDAASKGRTLKTSGKNNWCARAVLQYDLQGNFIREWDCIMDATRSLGKIHSGPISYQCKNKKGYNHAYGFKWKYK